MKWIVIEAVLVAVVVGAAVKFGQDPTRTRWGEPGMASMWAATWICVAASVAAIVPVAAVAAFVPKYLAQTVLAGTAIRILVTGGLALLYQMMVEEHLPSLLMWLLVLYLPLLAVETVANVMLIRAATRRLASVPLAGVAEASANAGEAANATASRANPNPPR